ncbi:GTP cyclohydrolase I FolE [Blochmannia endosymbiont of Camponotus (Colobopsis) obliquus]|uniref:GTP cyclohydrolase I FolE n=1 Tax=Blochmannia endosymbiont of Camponotus (Colobopsis) obliquus TaxID=1505597 RepID=UPI00061A6B1E|nr:GTP cyclohydrolase I FolE [Blochmannia endosymbiont of Camponotus (Colobopsis) obliquus]AKC60624.1 GTP cyclohydrolase 1 [Blochmannia endosymbiont of Camponotus (Colobopsis) obliquus]
MLGWTKEASLVYDNLLMRGLEVPLSNKKRNNESCKNHIAIHMMKIMTLLNLDMDEDSIMDTPNRIAKMYVEEIFSGLDYLNFPKITILKNKMKVDEMIAIRNISLTSTCEHHFVIFDGKATVAYIPKNSVIGLSKISRIVRFFSQRPQVQERLTQQIFFALQVLLDTNDVAISIDAVHFCIKARGVRDNNTVTTTTSLGGSFKSSENIRREFLYNVI